MPHTMFLEIQVNVSVTLKYPLGPFMCMAEQLVTNLQVLQRLLLQEKVPASENIVFEVLKHELNGYIGYVHVCMM